MKILIKILLSLVSLVLIYFLIWFSWGSYTKNYVKSLIDKAQFLGTNLSYNQIHLSGFPFNIKLKITDLQLKNNEDLQIRSPEVILTTNFTIQKINLIFDPNIYISQKDSQPFIVKFKKGAQINAKLYLSALRMKLSSSNFNLTDISTINYVDDGFTIINPEKGEKIFISKSNSIKMQSFITAPNDYNIILQTHLNGRSTLNLDNTQPSEENPLLNTYIILSVGRSGDFNINNMKINFIKCTLTTDQYTINILGHMDYKKHLGFNGQINVNITDLPGLFDFLNSFITENSLKKWQAILAAMNEQVGTKPIHNLSIRITGNHNEIKWGKLLDHNLTKMLGQ